MVKKIFKFLLGFAILFAFYYLSFFIVKSFNIKFPAAVLSLIFGIVKEEWIDTTVNFLLKNMALLFVPFVVGLSAYKSFLAKNFVPILLVVLVTTTLTIVFTGLLAEYGIKFVRLLKIKGAHRD